MNNDEKALEQFLSPSEDLNAAFTRSVVFDVDEGYKDNLPAHIIANFDEVKAALAAGTAKDRAVVVTAETIDAAKARCAQLNKTADRIEEVRKEVKKNWMKPYLDFEARCKECVQIVTSARETQWSQVKAFEDAAKEAKKAALEAYWKENAPELVQTYFRLDDVMQSSWLTKGKKLDTAKSELGEVILSLTKDLHFIRNSADGQYAAAGFIAYSQTRSIPEALTAIEKAKAVLQAPKSEDPVKEAVEAMQSVKADEEVVCIDFRVYATRTQLNALKAWLSQNGVKYGRVPKGEEQ